MWPLLSLSALFRKDEIKKKLYPLALRTQKSKISQKIKMLATGFRLEKLLNFFQKSLYFCQCTLAQRFWKFYEKPKFQQPVKGFSLYKQIALLERKLWNQEQIPLLWSFLTLRKSLRSSSTKYITTLCAALDASHTHQIPTVLQVSYCSSH